MTESTATLTSQQNSSKSKVLSRGDVVAPQSEAMSSPIPSSTADASVEPSTDAAPLQKFACMTDEEIAESLTKYVDDLYENVMCGFIPKTWVKTIVMLVLIYLGLSISRTAKLSGFCRETVRKKKLAFENSGVKNVFIRKEGVGRKSKMTECVEGIIDGLKSNEFRSVRQIKHFIESKIKNSICLTSVRNFLDYLGYKYLKCGAPRGRMSHVVATTS